MAHRVGFRLCFMEMEALQIGELDGGCGFEPKTL